MSDDNTPEGQDPKLEFKVKGGTLAKTYFDEPHEWIQDLIDSLQGTISFG